MKSMQRFLSRCTALLLISLALGACTMPALVGGVGTSLPTPAPVVAPLVSVPDNATPTPTPFQPLPTSTGTPPSSATPLATSTPTAGPPWGEYPGPTVNPSIPIPPPVGLLPQPEGQINILLMGSDQRPRGGGFRTDTLVLLTVNPATRQVSLTSFPRDLYIYIPGWTMQRINTAQAYGGFPTTAQTFEYNFGVRPDHYVMITFWGFTRLIDSLGGINVNVAIPLSDHRTGYGTYYVPAGTVRMNGETALWYVRSRYTSSDFDRTRRQQEVLVALFYRLLSLDAVSRAPELYNLYRQSVTTDMDLDDMLPFLPLATQIGNNNAIQRYAVGREHVTSWTTPGGAAVLLPNREAVLGVMRQALNSLPPP